MRLRIINLIIICLLLNGLIIKGQDIPLIPLDNAEWEYELYDPESIYWRHQYIIGDSILGNYTYTKFRIDYYQASMDWQNYVADVSNGHENVLIRIDNGRIYKYIDESSEKILFDSNWTVGDTIIDNDNEAGDSIYVLVNIDTVVYDNIERRRWTFDNPTMMIGTVSFVEGIGSMNFNISEPIFNMFWEGGGILQCFTQNSIHITGNRCYKSLDISRNIYDQEIILYPVPAKNELILESGNPELQNIELTLFDINGRIVYYEYLIDINNKISIPEHFNGTYLLKIENSNYNWYKLIIIN